MNRLHHWLCRSGRWRATLQTRVPWVIGGVELGPDVLELGPGPGLTTEQLRMSVNCLTALELDPKLAHRLSSRLARTNVRVIQGDATAMPFDDGAFSAVVSFTMLHHVPTATLQDQILHEVFRVLKPGGCFVGTDSLNSWVMKIIHIGDTLLPIDPDTFGSRLQSVGFEVLDVETNKQAFRFRARKPGRRTLINN